MGSALAGRKRLGGLTVVPGTEMEQDLAKGVGDVFKEPRRVKQAHRPQRRRQHS